MKRQELIDEIVVYLEKVGVQPQGTFLEVQPTETTKGFVPESLIADFIEQSSVIKSIERKAFEAAFKWFGVSTAFNDNREIIEDAFNNFMKRK